MRRKKTYLLVGADNWGGPNKKGGCGFFSFITEKTAEEVFIHSLHENKLNRLACLFIRLNLPNKTRI